jgi:acyl-CoA synthetase (AMP-forming)/AMP-acid ligase II
MAKLKRILDNHIEIFIFQFVKRFGIKRICEFYGATEGNSSVINIDSRQV